MSLPPRVWRRWLRNFRAHDHFSAVVVVAFVVVDDVAVVAPHEERVTGDVPHVLRVLLEHEVANAVDGERTLPGRARDREAEPRADHDELAAVLEADERELLLDRLRHGVEDGGVLVGQRGAVAGPSAPPASRATMRRSARGCWRPRR